MKSEPEPHCDPKFKGQTREGFVGKMFFKPYFIRVYMSFYRKTPSEEKLYKRQKVNEF